MEPEPAPEPEPEPEPDEKLVREHPVGKRMNKNTVTNFRTIYDEKAFMKKQQRHIERLIKVESENQSRTLRKRLLDDCHADCDDKYGHLKAGSKRKSRKRGRKKTKKKKKKNKSFKQLFIDLFKN